MDVTTNRQLTANFRGRLAALCLFGLSLQCLGQTNAFDKHSPWMLGDWGGTRSELLEEGFSFSAGYVSEAASNVDGGYDDDTVIRYTDQFELGVKIDLDKILGLPNAQFNFVATNRSGNSLSGDRIGDPRAGQLSSVQEVYGRGQTLRLTDLSYLQSFSDGRWEIKLGRFGVGEDFNSFPCDFQNLAFCGSQIGNWTDVWYNWPVSQLAFRLKWNVTPNWYLQLGVFDQNPNELKKSNAFRLKASGSAGVLTPFEVVWHGGIGDKKLPGEYRVGYFISSANAEDVLEDINGDPQPLTGLALKEHGSKDGAWLVAQQQLTSHRGDVSRGLSVFANLTFHDESTDRVDEYQQVGLVYTGLFDGRPKDDIGLGFARIHINDDLKTWQRLSNEAGGVADYKDPAFQPLQYTEYDMELHYGFKIADWLTLRPNLQYVWRPGGVKEVDDAFVIGLKLTMTL